MATGLLVAGWRIVADLLGISSAMGRSLVGGVVRRSARYWDGAFYSASTSVQALQNGIHLLILMRHVHSFFFDICDCQHLSTPSMYTISPPPKPLDQNGHGTK